MLFAGNVVLNIDRKTCGGINNKREIWRQTLKSKGFWVEQD